MSRRGVALVLGVLFAALVTAAAFIASTYEDSAKASEGARPNNNFAAQTNK